MKTLCFLKWVFLILFFGYLSTYLSQKEGLYFQGKGIHIIGGLVGMLVLDLVNFFVFSKVIHLIGNYYAAKSLK